MSCQLAGLIRSVAMALLLAQLASCGGGDKSEVATAQSAPHMKALAATAAQPLATVTAITKVSEGRVSRTVYDYVFKVTVQNGANALTGVAAKLLTVGQGTTIVDGDVIVGDLAAGASKTSDDTITLRHDRTFVFNQTALTWNVTGTPIETINGIVVPPEPDPVKNSATLAGIDTDGNGIRDDIDRKIALNFGQNKSEYDTAIVFARSLQSAIVTPGEANRAEHISSFLCLSDALLTRLSYLTYAAINTSARGRAYADAFGGSTIGDEGCVK